MQKQNRPHWPAPGRMLRELVRRYYSHNIGRDSAALTYYLLFAIFPLLVFTGGLLNTLQLDQQQLLDTLSRLVPEAVAQLVSSYLAYAVGEAGGQLLWFSLVFSIWFPMRAASCLMHSIRKAYGSPPPRHPLIRQLRNFIFAVWLMAMIGLTLLVVTAGHWAMEALNKVVTIPPLLLRLWGPLRFVLLAGVLFAMLVPLYLLARGQRRPLGEILPGAIGSLLVWMLLSLAFSYYVEHLARYTELYGSISTIVVALLWLYMSAVVLVMGAEFNGALLAEREQYARQAEPGREETL